MKRSAEIKAMDDLERCLSSLDRDQQWRVLNWASERYSFSRHATSGAMQKMLEDGRKEVESLTDRLLAAVDKFNEVKEKGVLP